MFVSDRSILRLYLHALVLAGLLIWQPVLSQEAAPTTEITEQPATASAEGSEVVEEEQVIKPDPNTLSWDVRIDLMIRERGAFEEIAEVPDELFIELSQLLRIRARQFELILNDASSRSEPADSHIDILKDIFPAVPKNLLPLPDYVVTVQEAHENFLGLYKQRNRLLEYVSEDLRAEITSTDLVGLQQLYFEFNLIFLELRYQVLRLPDVRQQIAQMIQRAPLPLVWFVLQLILFVALFRWWRRWFPETLNRMQSYLRTIRPRTNEIVSRMRAIWYVQQVRSPLEWLVLFVVTIQLLEFLDLIFISSITSVIVSWILLAWFAVEFLDALVARGAGGLTSEIGRTRQKSLRWFAAWIVLLGLGLSLAERLAGDAALYALVWRIVQVLFFPLLLLQLGLWRTQFFRRAEREDPEFMTLEQFKSQRWLGKYIGSAKLCGFLVATKLRNTLLRSLEELGTSRVSGSSLSPLTDKEPDDKITQAIREKLLTGPTDYEKYARIQRRQLIDRIERGVGGAIVIIGERGIGKDGFITQVCEKSEVKEIVVDCEMGSADSIEEQLAEALGLTVPLDDPEEVARALEAKNIGVIATRNVHLLARPVVGGFEELNRMSAIMDKLPGGIIRVIGMDRYAWFYIRRALAERASSVDRIELPEWTDEQIGELIEARCELAGLDISFSDLRVPSQYLDGAEEDPLERNRKGVYTMAARLSGGNASIAMEVFVQCLRLSGTGQVYATLPVNRDTREIERAPIHMLLMLRAIAQAGGATIELLEDNLRYPRSVIENALQFALDRGWIEIVDDHYSLSLTWFRSVTRVLSRQNLLAGVTEEIS